jgi:transcriptional regulator with XRE-family HTH domain
MMQDGTPRPMSCEDWTSSSHNVEELDARRGRGRGDEAWVNNAGFGALLRACRQRGSLTQERLANRSGLSVRTIREFEAGRVGRPRAESVRLLADALQLARSERERFEETARGSYSASLSRIQLGPSAPKTAAPSQLPPNIADFVGHTQPTRQHRDRFSGRAEGTASEGGDVVISAIVGVARIGKSDLALDVVHKLAEDFPDGQQYVNPHGTSGGALRLHSIEVLSWLLRAMGWTAASSPPRHRPRRPFRHGLRTSQPDRVGERADAALPRDPASPPSSAALTRADLPVICRSSFLANPGRSADGSLRIGTH